MKISKIWKMKIDNKSYVIGTRENCVIISCAAYNN